MKNHTILTLLFILTLGSASGFAQGYAINWHKVAGGGGASSGTTGSGGVYTVGSTAGQHDASTAMTGSGYSLTGGFWALFAVQTPGAPLLSIAESGNSAIVSWFYPLPGYVLQTNNNLSMPANWGNYTGAVTLNGTGTSNTATITPSLGNLFFRLKNP